MIAGLLVPALVTAFCAYVIVADLLEPASLARDASGMTMVAITMLGSMAILVSLAFGVPAAILTMRYLRGGRGR
jgi:hypothetical protein